jgi:competence protein ComEA
VKFFVLRVAIVGALVLTAAAVCVVRPAALAVHRTEPPIARSADPAAKPLPLRLHARPLVYVAGAVVRPGVYGLGDDARVRDAVAEAGGATRDADLVAVNLAAHVADGEEVAVPHLGDPRPAARASRGPAAHQGRRRRSSPRRRAPVSDAAPPGAAESAKVDLNSATEDALAELPGIGPVLAERIVEFRALNGPFATVDGLADVAGITPAHLDGPLERRLPASRQKSCGGASWTSGFGKRRISATGMSSAARRNC